MAIEEENVEGKSALGGENRTAKTSVIYLRVPADVKRKLDDLATDRMGVRGLSRLINKVLLHFANLDTMNQNSVLDGGSSSSPAGMGAVHQWWGAHAFLKEEWEWACQEYLKLSEVSTSRDVRKFAQFRLGYCWIEVALALKNRAIEHRTSPLLDLYRVREIFDEVRESLVASLTFYMAYIREEKPGQARAVARYNVACLWALMAESLAQLNCECTDGFLDVDVEMDEDGKQRGWKEFREHWNRCTVSKVRKRVDKFADKSLNTIRELKREASSSMDGHDFLFRLAGKDRDLAFLRLAYWGEFKEAITLPDSDAGDAYKKILKKTKPTVDRRVRELGVEEDVEWDL